MMFASKKQWLVIATLTAMSINSCASHDSEDDESMQAEEPVDAAPSPAESADAPNPSTAPEAKPAASVGSDSASASATAPGVPAATSGEARVMYVKFDGVAVREKADSKSKRVGQLNRGDHILVAIDGDWARTQDGKFIAVKSLSEKGIGPSKKDAQWSAGSGKNGDASAAPPSEQAAPAKKLPRKPKSANKKNAAESAQPSATEPAAAPSGNAPAK